MKQRTKRLQCASIATALLLAGAVGCGDNNEPNNETNNTSNATTPNNMTTPNNATSNNTANMTSNMTSNNMNMGNENPMADPSADVSVAVDATQAYTISGLNPDQAYRITLVVDGNITVSGGAGTFVDNDDNGAADAGASEAIALITSVNGNDQAGAKTVPGGDDDPANPSGVNPSSDGEITFVVTGVAEGKVHPVIYHNGGESTFLEIDGSGVPTETHIVAGGLTVEPGDAESLYDQIGGETAVRAVLDEFILEVAADDRINWMFANSDLDMLKNMLHDQVCEATGGGCTYMGEDMKTAHTGMAITDAQFDALIEDFLAALDTLGVPYALDGTETIDPLLMALVGMRADIVEDADGDMVLFNQLGGYAAVGAVVDEILSVVAADARINGFFADTDLDMLRALLVEQICEATGGFCTYSGRTMAESHAGLGIGENAWNWFIEDTLTALDNLGIPYALDGSETIDPLLITLVGMKGDIVEEAPAAAPAMTSTIAVDGTVDYTISGLVDTQAYRITLVVDGDITAAGGVGTFVDGDMNGAADAGASENIALITTVNGTDQTGAKTVPAGSDDPAAPTGVFPTNGEITITVTGVAAGTVYPVIYHNGGASTFLEIDSSGAPTEIHVVAGAVTVQ